MTLLTGRQRRHLRALAHAQKAVVQVGHAGLTQPVIVALDHALETHELVKVKVTTEAPAPAAELAPEIERATQSSVAQVIGRTLIVYRRRKENPTIVLPRAPRRKPSES